MKINPRNQFPISSPYELRCLLANKNTIANLTGTRLIDNNSNETIKLPT